MGTSSATPAAYAAEQLGHSLKMFFEVYAGWINRQRTLEEQAKFKAGVGSRTGGRGRMVDGNLRKLR